MKKFLLFFAFFALLTIFLMPQPAVAAIVPCGNEGQAACTIKDFFTLIANIFDFIVKIATALAGLIVVIGGVLILLSGINAKWYETGKSMIKIAIIAILLIWGSVLIIDTVLKAIGYNADWNFNPFN